MRKFLLATSAAALALAFSGHAQAELAKIPVAATTIAPPETTTADGLVFSKDADQAKPMDKAAEPAASPAQAQPEAKPEAKPAQQAAPAMITATLSAEGAAVADRLRDLAETKLQQYVPNAQDRAGVLAFYRARNFAPIWTASGKPAPRAGEARVFLLNVAADGLNPGDYPTPSFSHSDPAQLAADELALTNSVVSYARHASIGRVAFTRASGAVYYDQKAPNAADVLGQLAASTDLRATLDAFQPQAPGYKALKAQLAAIRSSQNAEPKLEPKAELRTSAPELTIINEGKAKNKKKGHAEQDKAKEIKPKTASADTIIANMERWRWMPHDIGATYVMVNIPDYTLKVVKDGKTIWTTKIVVGKPGEQATPLLTETMKYITVNPTWNVPPSIIRNEYLPALARDPGALARVGLQVGRNPDGSVRIFQPPGERNALGRIRFNFPNRFLVYQHDTPQKHLFAHDARAYSHGCMRVQNPDEYAEVLLGVSQPEEKYTAARIRSMYGSSERTINFKRPIPVYITYQTAFADDAGKTQARSDIYGLDRDLLNILHGDRRNSDTPIARNYNSNSKPVMSAAPSTPRSRQPRYASNPGYTTWGSSGSTSWNSGSSTWGSEFRSASQPADRSRVW